MRNACLCLKSRTFGSCSGVKDEVIPVANQLLASQAAPGAWLMQSPTAGHVRSNFMIKSIL